MFMLPDKLLAERRQKLLEEEGRSAPDTLLAEAKGGSDASDLPGLFYKHRLICGLPICIPFTREVRLWSRGHGGGPVAWQLCSLPIPH